MQLILSSNSLIPYLKYGEAALERTLPTRVYAQYANAVGTHADTQRFTYTVPANTVTYIQQVILIMTVTAGATVGALAIATFYLHLSGGAKQALLRCRANSYATQFPSQSYVVNGLTLNAGDIISFNTECVGFAAGVTEFSSTIYGVNFPVKA
jgi:hypothetical protein